MSGLEVVGAYLAETLTRAGVYSMNSHQTIYITSPEYNNSGQIIFRDNIQPMIRDKNILILDGSITTGETLSRAIESILYYGGAIRGIASIFSAATSIAGLPVYSIFNHQGSSELWFLSCCNLSFMCPETETGCIGKWLRLFQDLICKKNFFSTRNTFYIFRYEEFVYE